MSSPQSAPAPGVVLLAEDSAVVRAMVRQVLETAGYSVIEAANGELAYEQFLVARCQRIFVAQKVQSERHPGAAQVGVSKTGLENVSCLVAAVHGTKHFTLRVCPFLGVQRADAGLAHSLGVLLRLDEYQQYGRDQQALPIRHNALPGKHTGSISNRFAPVSSSLHRGS